MRNSAPSSEYYGTLVYFCGQTRSVSYVLRLRLRGGRRFLAAFSYPRGPFEHRFLRQIFFKSVKKTS